MLHPAHAHARAGQSFVCSGAISGGRRAAEFRAAKGEFDNNVERRRGEYAGPAIDRDRELAARGGYIRAEIRSIAAGNCLRGAGNAFRALVFRENGVSAKLLWKRFLGWTESSTE